MARKLTITVSDEVYAALYHDVGAGRIAAFVERHLRPLLRLGDDLEKDYAAYAEWLAGGDGETEAAEIDDWLSGDADTPDAAEENSWPESWRRKAGPAAP